MIHKHCMIRFIVWLVEYSNVTTQKFKKYQHFVVNLSCSKAYHWPIIVLGAVIPSCLLVTKLQKRLSPGLEPWTYFSYNTLDILRHHH
jgi:hypothetical protein